MNMSFVSSSIVEHFFSKDCGKRFVRLRDIAWSIIWSFSLKLTHPLGAFRLANNCLFFPLSLEVGDTAVTLSRLRKGGDTFLSHAGDTHTQRTRARPWGRGVRTGRAESVDLSPARLALVTTSMRKEWMRLDEVCQPTRWRKRGKKCMRHSLLKKIGAVPSSDVK